MENKRQKIEIADIFRSAAPDFFSHYTISVQQKKAFQQIINCRTEALGKHEKKCNSCGHTEISYNSCRNRHCPKCGYIKKEQWIDQLSAKIPPVKLFHVVFTIPACLRKLFYINQKIGYSLFFKAAWKTLQQTAINPKHFGAEIGGVGVLHTWGQTLVYHPHIHFMIPAGGLDEDQMEWIPANKDFFLNVKYLSKVFRNKLFKMICLELKQKNIRLPDDMSNLQQLEVLCYKKKWVVYCEKPCSSSNHLIKYLGNYSERVAISNHRLIAYTDDKVTFTYKDYTASGVRKTMCLQTNEFIRRFLQHILPNGFCKIRYFGFLANINSNTKLKSCFDSVQVPAFLPILKGLNAMEAWGIITGKDPFLCPKCQKGKMITQYAQKEIIESG